MVAPVQLPRSAPAHFFTVDVEEYFHVNAFESVITRTQWQGFPRRLDRVLPPLLDALARHEARGTFFVLGWLAEREPHLIRRIAEAGHEVASHGYWHRRVPTMSPAEFREDLRASRTAIEGVVGARLLGFRAPSFSILPGFEWAFDILLEEGFRYDSSVFPIRRRGYGYPSAPRVPHLIQRAAGTLAEFPLATTSLGRLAIPAAGGAYLRHFPLQLIRHAFATSGARGIPSTFYIHPWEFDSDQPRMPVSFVTRIRHYRGLSDALPRVQRLLAEFRFVPIATHLDQLVGASTGASVDLPSH